jgi:phosphoribosylformylglycinamidine synthase
VEHQHLGGLPPKVDLEAERALAVVLTGAAEAGEVAAAHDLSDGGLAQTLVEACLRFGTGASVNLEHVHADAFTALFSESTARAVVAITAASVEAFLARCVEAEVPATAIGATGGEALTLQVQLGDASFGWFNLTLDELREAHTATLPAVLNS